MATNAPTGDGRRNGAVRKRTQLKTKVMGEEHYTKRSKETRPVHRSEGGRKEVQRRPQGSISPARYKTRAPAVKAGAGVRVGGLNFMTPLHERL